MFCALFVRLFPFTHSHAAPNGWRSSHHEKLSRYVADATPFKLRTLTSSAFAMAMAMGSAMGPGMAIVLDGVPEFQFNLPFLRTQYFNGMTGPGYFMSMNWFVYTLCIAFFFREPTRSGLEELKKREEKLYYDGVELAEMSSGSIEFPRRVVSEDCALDDAIQRQDSLLSKGSIESNTERSWGGAFDCCSCVKNITRPVLICMSLIFMKRITLESIVGSTSIITKNRYGWTIKNVGALHLANGIIVIPVSIFSGYLSTLFEDRYMMIWFMSITLFGMAFLFDPTDLFNLDDSNTYNEGQPGAVGPHRYIAGSLVAFSGVEACESYIASLISKVVPSALAQGTFNSGLLATLVGTVRTSLHCCGGLIFVTGRGNLYCKLMFISHSETTLAFQYSTQLRVAKRLEIYSSF